MKCVVELNEAEEITLQQLSINHRHRDTRTRAAGLLMLGRRIKPKVIALQLDVSGQTVYNWVHAWRDSGVCGLMGGHNGGRPRAVSEAMVATALHVARAESLTLARIAQRVQAVHGEPLPCRIETLGEALKREGFSFKRNRYALKKKRPVFAVKAATLEKLQCAARDGHGRLFYFDEAGFRAAPPVQRSWSPRGLPHCIEPNSHCKRSVVGALNFGENSFIYAASARTVKGPDIVEFLDTLIRQGDGRPTVIVLDNASIHHSIDQATLDFWFIEHKALLFYLPPYSPELNLIEIVWKHFKYHWRRFVTWTKETIDTELVELLNGYGTRFQVNFS